MKSYYLDLFSGIGGFALGAYWAGLRFEDHYFSEVDDYAVRLYQKRFPRAKPLGDIRSINYADLPKGEWLATGGFPCQPHSSAGKRRGAGDERDLWSECSRMLCELQPRIALFENVPELLVSNGGEFFNRVMSDIFQNGYDAEWQIISAAAVGAPHRRKRVWLVAYPSSLRLRQSKQEHELLGKKSFQNPAEWERFQSIVARGYKIYHWQDHEQELTGAYDGLPEELDAIKGAGNAIVPQCAELIFSLSAFDKWRQNS
jgi:DNA (cytosine-5)-methyltransferase 1